MSHMLPELHQHYRDTFRLIREREQLRDRLFFGVVGTLGALLFCARYPQGVPSVLFVGGEVISWRIGPFPAAVIVSVAWTVLLMWCLKYCQCAVLVERQYRYLHLLEDRLSDLAGDDTVFRREGRAYESDYPLVSAWAYVIYTWVFPLVALVGVSTLLVVEWLDRAAPALHLWYDTALALATFVTVVLYRPWPRLCKRGTVHRSSGVPAPASEQKETTTDMSAT